MKCLKIPKGQTECANWRREGQTTQLSKEKGQKDKQRSTKHFIEN